MASVYLSIDYVTVTLKWSSLYLSLSPISLCHSDNQPEIHSIVTSYLNNSFYPAESGDIRVITVTGCSDCGCSGSGPRDQVQTEKKNTLYIGNTTSH